MSTVTQIRPRQPAGGLRRADDFDTFSVEATDLVAAVDDHTRDLLERKPTARRRLVVPRALILADVLGLSAAYLVAVLLWGGLTGPHRLGSPRELLLFVFTLLCWVILAGVHNLYNRDVRLIDHSTVDDAAGVVHVVAIAALVLLVASRLDGGGPNIDRVLGFCALAPACVLLARLTARRVCRHRSAYEQNTVIVGAGDVGQRVARELVMHPEYGMNLVGFVDREPRARRADLPEHLTVLGGLGRLPEIIACLDVERVVIAFSSEQVPDLLAILGRLHGMRVQIDVVPRLFELVGSRVEVHSIAGLPLAGLPPAKRRGLWAMKPRRS